MSDGVTDYRSFMTAFMGLIAAGTATTALVLVTALIGIAPPWPSAIVQITAVSQLVILVLAYQFSIGSTRKTINLVMVIAAGILAVGAVCYLSLFSLLTYNHGVRGFICTMNATAVYGDGCPLLDQRSIDEASSPDVLWTPVGLLLGRMTLLVAWIVSFAALVGLVGTFVAFQRKRQVGRRQQPAD
ncbi:hypothetical protein [Rhizobium leguminosarum]